MQSKPQVRQYLSPIAQITVPCIWLVLVPCLSCTEDGRLAASSPKPSREPCRKPCRTRGERLSRRRSARTASYCLAFRPPERVRQGSRLGSRRGPRSSVSPEQEMIDRPVVRLAGRKVGRGGDRWENHSWPERGLWLQRHETVGGPKIHFRALTLAPFYPTESRSAGLQSRCSRDQHVLIEPETAPLPGHPPTPCFPSLPTLSSFPSSENDSP